MKKGKTFLRLLAFEWKKNFLSPWMVMFLAVLMIANSWKLHTEYEKNTAEFSDYKATYEEFYSRWSGTITTENVHADTNSTIRGNAIQKSQ